MSKKRKNRAPSELPVHELMRTVGENFVQHERRLIAASDSAHKVVLGELDGQSVAVKPYRSKHGLQYKARNEFNVTNEVWRKGIRTAEPLKVIPLKRQRVALYISRYIPDLIGAHTLSYESDPETFKGAAVSEAVTDVVGLLGSLHDKGITHGDAQLKNFAFSSHDVFSDRHKDPYVYDFENGMIHQEGAASQKFVDASRGDIQKLVHSLGSRQYGGFDDEVAEDLIREHVVEQYLEASSAYRLGTFATARVVDRTMANFQNGRENKKIYNPSIPVNL